MSPLTVTDPHLDDGWRLSQVWEKHGLFQEAALTYLGWDMVEKKVQCDFSVCESEQRKRQSKKVGQSQKCELRRLRCLEFVLSMN